jgi:hypothetical protein
MAGKREKPEDIVMKLRQVEVLQGQGMSVAEAVRQVGMTQQTYYRSGPHRKYFCQRLFRVRMSQSKYRSRLRNLLQTIGRS